MGIQRYIHTEKNNNLNIINDSTFLPLKNLLDSLYRRLHSEGVGCSVKKTEALTDNDEDSLWTAGILDPHTAEGLLNCVFFLNGKNFCLRGGLEHQNLSPTQLQREVMAVWGKTLVRYTYTEYVFKTVPVA